MMKETDIEWLLEPKDMMSFLISVICGCIIGIEREYNNKSAGLRTIVLICLGSTIFTIVSKYGVGSDDRISANIITGIGFIGAGVIFKDRLSVLGLTTAAVIWTTAGIGMAAGIGYHALALTLTAVTIIVLSLFTKVEALMALIHNQKLLNITFENGNMENLHRMENFLKERKVKNKRISLRKEDERLYVILEVTGTGKRLARLDEEIIELPYIIAFS
ncbi:MgtC/SapB family protein [Olivibacter domesticus]|uniref:Putative Mg2+ transporter-C (MgtC) family protein n=1 Tax=Olivibacter domesticus TaxID=407022 RepID=A0A1H7MM95_OLID1|nr:MgtC/SapB family protein [Olivibacter domesticus]SEL11727.1 putative Mg2+ transporter-C (MgtC) family protein [Olivibacter domesticus]